MDTFIEIKGARENNLENISLRIPKNKLVVFTDTSPVSNRPKQFQRVGLRALLPMS